MDSEKDIICRFICKSDVYMWIQYEEYLKRHANATFIRKGWFFLKRYLIGNKCSELRGKEITVEDLKRKINEHMVISFDIFDTLLLRPYTKPTDLFMDLGKYYQDEKFYSERIAAEKRAREKNQRGEDVTLEQIYVEMNEPYKKYKTKELEWEQKNIYANPQMLDILQYALSMGKEIVICSDMYLSKDFLSHILEKNGFRGISKLYISSELMKTKYTGKLFEYMLGDLKVSPKCVIHIGDNAYSDGNAYRMYNIDFVGIYKEKLWEFV